MDSEKKVVQATDAIEGSWVYRIAPVMLRPYLKLARLDRPVGTWLLLWPCLWSLALAYDGQPIEMVLKLALLFAVGALAMRGAGCTYNDIMDQDIDAAVERTKTRPIPAGEVSAKQAWVFLVVQCLVGLIVLLQLNPFAIWLGIASLGLVACYPFMKRITGWPQAWLGLTFNWGALMGWAAMNGSLDWAAAVLYAGGVLWTLGYDTIYAHQDKEDDALVGIGSSALSLGDKTKPALMVFYSLFFIALILAGSLANLPYIYYALLAPAGLHLSAQIWRLDINEPQVCLDIFRSNTGFGGLVVIALLVAAVFA